MTRSTTSIPSLMEDRDGDAFSYRWCFILTVFTGLGWLWLWGA